MGIYLKKYSSLSNIPEIDHDGPCVIYVQSDNQIIYSPNVIINANGYEYIDFNLPSGNLWAVYNVGADSSNIKGNYYCWGYTTPTTSYNNNYGNNTSFTIEQDAAHVNMGGDWCIPSLQDFSELSDYTTYSYDNSNNSIIFTSKADPSLSIFLPLRGSSRTGRTDEGYYMTTDIGTTNTAYYMTFSFESGSSPSFTNMPRAYGTLIRPIIRKNRIFNSKQLLPWITLR